MTTKDNGLFTEIETRLAELLDDFMGGVASRNVDEGIDGHGVLVRIVGPDNRAIEITVAIKDVTEELGPAPPEDPEGVHPRPDVFDREPPAERWFPTRGGRAR